LPEAVPGEGEILEWCIAYLADTYNIGRERIDPRAKFARLGMDSAQAVLLIADMEEWLGVELEADAPYNHPTPTKLAQYVAGRARQKTS
jgi:acyl carrier protein